MSKQTEKFEEYKLVYNFINPNVPLKGWINEENYSNLYAKDWDDLMEVIEKIDKTSPFVLIQISPNKSSISVFDIDGKNHFTTCPKVNTLECKMIDATYKAVVNFIEWYNEQKPKP